MVECWNSMLSVMVLEVGYDFGKCLSLEGGTLVSGISALIKKKGLTELSSPFHPVRTQTKVADCIPKEGVSGEPHHAGTVILDF